jgi:transcriptional regulator with XRE-family HTH domain
MLERVPDVADVVAENVRRLRLGHAWSQGELAARMRLLGVRWTRVTVAQFETRGGKSRRNVTLGEALSLAKVLGIGLAALLETDADYVMIGSKPWAGQTLPSVAAGASIDLKIDASDWEQKFDWALVGNEVTARLDEENHCNYRWNLDPDRLAEFQRARSLTTHAERTAAIRIAEELRLTVLPEEIVFAAERRWGHTLLEERERKLLYDQRTRTASTQRMKALRGQVMRRLYKELREEIEEAANRAARIEAEEDL